MYLHQARGFRAVHATDDPAFRDGARAALVLRETAAVAAPATAAPAALLDAAHNALLDPRKAVAARRGCSVENKKTGVSLTARGGGGSSETLMREEFKPKGGQKCSG